MPEASQELLSLLTFLMPGFLVAWVIYSFTPHSKPNQFERTVQALIYTLAIRFFVDCERQLLEWIGTWHSFGIWSKNSEFLASFSTAILVGAGISVLLNRDYLHSLLRRFGLSKASSYPSEWCTVFYQLPRYCILHLKDERRLYGWVHLWSTNHENGHFFITEASWLGDREVPQDALEGILIGVKEVLWIEFIKQPEERHEEKESAFTAAPAIDQAEPIT